MRPEPLQASKSDITNGDGLQLGVELYGGQAFSPDGQLVARDNKDGMVQVRNLITGQTVNSRDGDFFLATTGDRNLAIDNGYHRRRPTAGNRN